MLVAHTMELAILPQNVLPEVDLRLVLALVVMESAVFVSEINFMVKLY